MSYILNHTAEEIDHKLDLIDKNKNLLPYPYNTALPDWLEDVGDGSILTLKTPEAITSGTRIPLNTCSLPAGRKYTIGISVTNILEEYITDSAGFALEVAINGREPITTADCVVLDLSSESAETSAVVHLTTPATFEAGLVIRPQIEDGEKKTGWVPYMDTIGSYVDERFNSTNTKIKVLTSYVDDKLDNVSVVSNTNYSSTFGVKEETQVGDILLVPNEAVSLASHAEGNNTSAGCKAFIIKGSRNIELDAPIDETIPESNVIGIYTLDSVNGIETGDEFSIQYNSNYDCWGTVVAVGVSNSELFTLTENEIAAYGAVPDDPNYSYEKNGDPELWFYNKPTIGTTPWGTGQHTEGEGTKAVGPQAHAEGYYTTASGKFSHAEGRNTFAAYCAHAEGTNTIASGERSHAQGFKSIATGYAAHAEGNTTQALGSQSHAGGNRSIARGSSSFAHGVSCESNGDVSFTTGTGTKATSTNQFVAGAYNATRDDAAFVIGNGSKDSSRSNAFVVMKDGSGELSKQGTSANSVVIKDTLSKVVEQCGVYEETTSNNTLIVNPEIMGDHVISTSNTGSIRKFGTNLLRTSKNSGEDVYNNNGIMVKADSERSGVIIDGTCTATAWALQPYFYASYFPAGHYTFFVEGLNTVHTAEKVYIVLKGKESVDSDQEVTLTRIDSTAPVVEFDIDQGVAVLKVQIVIKAGETFENEHIRFQLQAGSKTDFVPYKHFTTIEMEAGEAVVIQIDDLAPFTLIAQTEGNTITCKYPVSTKSYIDKKFKELEEYIASTLLNGEW